MMESSAKTSSSDHNAFISTAHLLPNSTATYWIAPHHFAAPPSMFCSQSTAFALNLNHEDDLGDHFVGNNNAVEKTELRDEDETEIPKLALFEKPLTPSDVGKLNRLVIPKQHAEKYFPLNGGADSGESGMLLSFEDELGKSWRFRYSYWNSSQSYVLTKGWSRFVKEKRLDAGDVVVFARHRAEAGRLFIGWRRRNSGVAGDDATTALTPPAAGWNRAFHTGNSNYWNQHQLPPSLPHQQVFDHQIAGSVVQSQPASVSGNSKTLRLFGVNMECLAADEPEPRSSQHQQQHHPYHQYYPNHMDTTFSGAADAFRQHHQG